MQTQICVLGGTGFVGTLLANRLNTSGMRVKILTRNREKHRHLLVLPHVSLIQTDVYNLTALQEQLRDCSAVINLIGILNEKGHRGTGFVRAHSELAKLVLQACQDTGVSRILQMSALNAHTNAPSHYLRSKGEAENFLLDHCGENIHVTCFRPSVIFGPHDSFINRFARLLKLTPLVFPLACPSARFAPVYVGDVVDIMIAAIDDESTYEKRIDLCGPEEYTLRELVEYTTRVMKLRRCILGLPNWAARLQATFLEFVPGKPFSLDNYRSLSKDSVCTNGVRCVTELKSIVPYFLGEKSRQARYQRFRGSNR